MINIIIKKFIETAIKYPDKIAVKEHVNAISFRELSKKGELLSSKIIDKNINNKPIGIYLPKGIDAILSIVGILYSGNFYVPLDVKSSFDRTKSIIEDLEDCLIITNNKFIKKISKIYKSKQIINIDTLNNCKKSNFSNVIDLDPAYIIFTSGSTGKPKGVVVSQRGVIDYITWAKEAFGISEKESICNQAPFYFDNSTLDIYLMLFYGATLHIVSDVFYSFPVKLLEYIQNQNINFVFWVPSVLVTISKLDILEKLNPICLKKVLFAGEVMPTIHYNYWKKKLPDTLFSNLYGPTEITVDCTYYTINREFSDEEVLPIGKQCENTSVIILNDNNDLCKTNEKGELCVRGSSLALGYWRDKEKTNSVFQQNPINNYYNDMIYRTGDIVFYNEKNEIIFVGRKDNQIKHMGYRIELGEIENALMGTGYFQNVCVIYDSVKSNIIVFYESESKKDLQ